MRPLLLALPLLLLAAPPAVQAQVDLSIGVALPGLSIGLNLPIYPDLQRVPGHPVYYAPQTDGNYFFHGSQYWVLQGDDWYASGWYNGPWRRVDRYVVPVYVLRVPVRYYRRPPGYFVAWQRDAPPRWGDHWGPDWRQRRAGWDRWDRRAAPEPAPLPTYQRRYPQSRYPANDEAQRAIGVQHGAVAQRPPRDADPSAPRHDASPGGDGRPPPARAARPSGRPSPDVQVPDRPAGRTNAQRPDPQDRPDRAERPQQGQRPDQAEQRNRLDKADRPAKAERSDDRPGERVQPTGADRPAAADRAGGKSSRP